MEQKKTSITGNEFIDSEPIMDSIYGVIKISAFEKCLISTKEMQRLRGIKQLGFVNLVYPDAEHSRFAHSLGVCHQAKMLTHQVKKNVLDSKRYQDWRNMFINEDDSKKHIKINTQEVITSIEQIIISAAALLHDLPHSAFSHEIETHNKDGKGIPVHDDFENNPAFFYYLFDYNKSEIAQIIKVYNSAFWELAIKDNKWKSCLTNNDSIYNEGYVKIDNTVTSDTILHGDSFNSENKLPILGVMIFELLLFDKCNMWSEYKNNKIVPKENGVKVAVDFDSNKKITWKPIKNWFRPYRKDIVANTICADLLDYLIRDGRNTGILSALDLKFFDRMTILKAYPDKTEILLDLAKLPDFCEHIVFDIFDHKRGVIRQSIITEILSFLQRRYLLAERVYQHRVVEGARTMLQEVSRLLTKASSITLKDLHNIENKDFAPINDASFFAWVLNLRSSDDTEILKAQNLTKMLMQRRIFREAVIIDADHDYHQGSYRGNDVNCQTLANTMLDDEKREELINKLNVKITELCEEGGINDYPEYDKEQLFTIGVRKYGKGYKIPRVLVCRPLNNYASDNIEVFPLFEAKKIESMNDRLLSMQKSYNSLWKVYLFVHPFFHQAKFADIHKEIKNEFLKYIHETTNIWWNNSIEQYENLLPEQDIDIVSFIKHNLFEDKSNILNKEATTFISKVFKKTNLSIDNDDFKLNMRSHKTAIIDKILKIDNGEKLLMEKTIQQKVIKHIDGIKFDIPNAASDGKEIVIDQLVAYIEKMIKSEGKDLFD